VAVIPGAPLSLQSGRAPHGHRGMLPPCSRNREICFGGRRATFVNPGRPSRRLTTGIGSNSHRLVTAAPRNRQLRGILFNPAMSHHCFVGRKWQAGEEGRTIAPDKYVSINRTVRHRVLLSGQTLCFARLG